MAIAYSKYDDLADVAVLGIYYYVRLISIGINFICTAFTALQIQKMKSHGVAKTNSEIAISTLSMRLFYYPIVQAIGRSGCAWYEMAYGDNFDRNSGVNFNPPNTTNTQFAAQCLMALSAPLISVGYLAIFLIMQPDASRRVNSFLSSVNCCKREPEEDARSLSSKRVKTALLDTFYATEPSPIHFGSDVSDVSYTEQPMIRDSFISNRAISYDPDMEGNMLNSLLFE